MSISKLNKEIAHLNIQCFKHYDYFYFMDVVDDTETVIPKSVYVRRFADLSMKQWIAHVMDAQNKD